MFRILFIVLKKKKYALIALAFTAIMTVISYYLTVASISNYSIKIYAEMSGLLFTIVSLAFSLVIALLFGGYIALIFFRRDIVRARALANKATSSTGVISGILGAGCPTCGAPILGFIGFPLVLFSLPLKGIELKIIAVLFLILSVFLICKNIRKNLICQAI